MKKLFGLIILAGVLSLGMISCNDDAVREFGDAQRPMTQFIDDLVLTNVVSDLEYSTGCMYEIHKEGRITQLCLKVPDDDTYSVVLWDLTDTTAIDGITVAVDSGVLTCQAITDVPVLAGSRIAVSITSNDFYIYEHQVNGIVIYPATYGDVTILAYGEFLLPMGIQFPDQFFMDDYYAGIVDFVFEPKLD